MGAGTIDRVSIRKRPAGLPIMFQSWRKLLFMHWQLPPHLLRPHIPEGLEIDTFDGNAWIGITPFAVKNLRPPFLPPLPFLSSFHEINVRTYVHRDGVPGVWFFSLDADSVLAVLGSRGAYRLPYYLARMAMNEAKGEIVFTSQRTGRKGHPVHFEACWRKGKMVGEAAPGSLEFFLVERYCLYAGEGKNLYRARIFHRPWRLQQAEVISHRSAMIDSQGLPKPEGNPLLHYSERQDTYVWPAEKIS